MFSFWQDRGVQQAAGQECVQPEKERREETRDLDITHRGRHGNHGTAQRETRGRGELARTSSSETPSRWDDRVTFSVN